MKYLTIKETAVRWGVSERTVHKLCAEGRVAGAQKFGSVWSIPDDAEKPMDPRKLRKQQSEMQMETTAVTGFSSKNVPQAERTMKAVNESKIKTSDRAEIPGGTEPEANNKTAINSAKPTRPAMPLLNTPFKSGHAREAAEAIEDPDLRNIALAEYYYFSGQPEKASETAEPYLMHEDVALCVSACWIYGYANLALNCVPKTKRVMQILHGLAASVNENTPLRDKILITCISTGAAVLLHLPLPKILTPLKTYIHAIPSGLRLFVLYIEAHHAYLNGQYGVAIGIAETALALEGELYPIPTVYLHLVAAMGYINMNHPELAKQHLEEAWEVGKPDDLIEAFGEHHGLLAGTLEATVKKKDPDAVKRMISITYKFSAGWRKVHNLETGNAIADNLTTTEFAASMLAARGWTNLEIATHMGLSEYTVRQYISIAMQKLNITRRADLYKHMLR